MENFYTREQIAERYGVKIATVWEWIREKKVTSNPDRQKISHSRKGFINT